MSLTSRFLVCVLFCSTLLAQSNNPVPFVNQPLVPASVLPGAKGFTLTVNGAGFVSGSVVNWNGSPRPTVALSGSSLQATIAASDVAQQTTGWVTVVNPSPGGGTSNLAYLFVRKPSPSVAVGGDVNFSAIGPDAVGDFNNDGKLDIAVAWLPSTKILEIDMYPGKGNGQFEAPVKTQFAHGPSLGSVLAADFNGDGNLDLAVNQGVGTEECKIEIFLGDGHGKFSAKGSFYSVCAQWAAADFNGDGKLDIFTLGRISAGCLANLFFGQGDGTFQGGGFFRLDGCDTSFGAGLAIGDFNRDGAIDFAFLRGGIKVCLNNGNGTFQAPVTYPVSRRGGGVAAADVNGDGILDLVSAGFSVLLGNGDGTFRNGSSSKRRIGGGPILVGDFNADGKVDLLFTSGSGDGDVVLLGKGDGTFRAPVQIRGVVDTYGFAMESADFFRKGSLGFTFPGGGVSGANNLPDYVFRQTDLNFLPSTMTFGAQQVGTTSPPQTATLTNVERSKVVVTKIFINGADGQDFSQTNNCPASLPVGGSCQIQVTFTPQATGYPDAVLNVSYGGSGSPQTTPLYGQGVSAR
jgi:FG-GAP-like repeat